MDNSFKVSLLLILVAFKNGHIHSPYVANDVYKSECYLVLDYNDNYFIQFSSTDQENVVWELKPSYTGFDDDVAFTCDCSIDDMIDNFDDYISLIEEEIEKYDKL